MPDYQPMATADPPISLDRATQLFVDGGPFLADRTIASLVIGVAAVTNACERG